LAGFLPSQDVGQRTTYSIARQTHSQRQFNAYRLQWSLFRPIWRIRDLNLAHDLAFEANAKQIADKPLFDEKNRIEAGVDHFDFMLDWDEGLSICLIKSPPNWEGFVSCLSRFNSKWLFQFHKFNYIAAR
jgi:hypothetical protein